jgi:hypothetical protein
VVKGEGEMVVEPDWVVVYTVIKPLEGGYIDADLRY